jgi:AGZA family xanthine/uracil permease-like MFS transporter
VAVSSATALIAGVMTIIAIVLMPFTYSISNGIGAGVIAYAVLKLARGRARDVHPLPVRGRRPFRPYFLRGPLEAML